MFWTATHVVRVSRFIISLLDLFVFRDLLLELLVCLDDPLIGLDLVGCLCEELLIDFFAN